jgi:hypothetical protein
VTVACTSDEHEFVPVRTRVSRRADNGELDCAGFGCSLLTQHGVEQGSISGVVQNGTMQESAIGGGQPEVHFTPAAPAV